MTDQPESAVPGSVVEALVCAGRNPRLDAMSADELERELGVVGAFIPSADWARACEQLDVEAVCALVRALVIGERELGWRGGSVAPAIGIFRLLAGRHYEAADELSAWIIPRRGNPYVPFGTLHECGARRLSELEPRRAERKREPARISQRDAIERKLQRLEHRRAIVEHELRSVASRIERERCILEALDLELTERLGRIAADPMPLEYWPDEFADVPASLIAALPTETAAMLRSRLRGRHTLAWRSLRAVLEAARDGG